MTITLSRDLIVSKSLLIIERDGIDALTMRQLAKELGKSPMAVYRYFESRHDLLLGVIDAVMPVPSNYEHLADPRERVFQQAMFYYEELSRKPWIVGALLNSGYDLKPVLQIAESSLEGLVRVGLTPDEAESLFRSLWLLVSGHVQMAAVNPERVWENSRAELHDNEVYPELSARLQAQLDRRRGLEFTLRRILKL